MSGKCRKNVGKCREMSENVGKCRKMLEKVGKSQKNVIIFQPFPIFYPIGWQITTQAMNIYFLSLWCTNPSLETETPDRFRLFRWLFLQCRNVCAPWPFTNCRIQYLLLKVVNDANSAVVKYKFLYNNCKNISLSARNISAIGQ